MSEDARPERINPHDRPARASNRLRGLAKDAYVPDPDTYLRDLRSEIQDGLATRDAAMRAREESDEQEPKASKS